MYLSEAKKEDNAYLVWLILFLEGFVSVSLQVIFIRQLMPFVGSDVTIVGLVIGIFLAALSLGYYRGGVSNNPRKKLYWNFMIAAALLSVSCSYLSMTMVFQTTTHFEAEYFKVVLYLIFGMSPVVYLLGQTMPLLTNMVEESSVSKITGKVLSVNTIGSVIGAVITPIVLFSIIGVGATVVLNAAVLCALVFLSRKLNDEGGVDVTYLVIPVIISLAFILNVSVEKRNFIKTTAYANYNVVEDSDEFGNHTSIFRLNNTSASAMANGGKISYIRYMYDYMIEQLDFVDHDILILGSGGFTFSLNDTTNNRYTYVDIDPKIKDIAERFFLKYEIKGDFVDDDARQFIKDKEKSYNLIVVDLYSSNINMPWHVTTKEFVGQVESALAEGGYAMFNVIHEMNFVNQTNKRLHNTISDIFDYCYSIPLLRGKQRYSNLVYVCKKPTGEPLEINVDDRV